MRISLWLVATLLALALPLQARASDPLPLGIVIDLDDIDTIDQFRGNREALEEGLADILRTRIEQRLGEYWVVAGPQAEHVMRLIIVIDSPDFPPLFTLELKGNIKRYIDGDGREPVHNPADGDIFANALSRSLRNFLRDFGGDLATRSQEVHAAASRGIQTELTIDRSLSAEEEVVYLTDEIWIKWSGNPDGTVYKRTHPDPFVVRFTLSPNTARTADVRPKVHRPIRAPQEVVARLCVHRPAIPDVRFTPVVSYNCPLTGDCVMRAANPVGWADDACENAAPGDQGSLWDAVIAAAHAAAVPGETEWHVPSLATLYKRLKTPGAHIVGFSEFEISAPELAGLDADAYTVALEANGVPVRIDGLPPEDDVRGLDLRDGLYFRFGLENLQFAGRIDGCEELSVTLRFQKNGEPAGEPLVLRRSYVALRDAHLVEYETDFGVFRWTGNYRAPRGRKENGIFLSSDWYPRGDVKKKERLLTRLNGLRATLDDFGWSIPAGELGFGIGLESVVSKEARLRIVGKIRPPRTIRDGKVAYGLLVGVEEPNGQLQFTFDPGQTEALKRRLRTLSAETRGARAVIPEKFYVYRYTKDRQSGPDWVCRRD